MADEFRRKAEQQDKELYEVARDAAKVAQREGHAQVQAAVEAARLLPGVETEQQRRAPRSSSLCLWTLSFRDGRLETAYIRHAETECDNHDHVAALCRLWACAPPLLMALSGHRLSCGWPLASASRAGLYMCVLCNLCIAVACALVLVVQLSCPDWYRSHRGTTLLWFASVLWVVESAQLFVKADDLRVYITQILVPAFHMSFTYRLPYIIHLSSRAFGLGCQAIAILGSANRKHAPSLLLTSLSGHTVGALLVYFLDRRSRQAFLPSLPPWLSDTSYRTRLQPPSFQSCTASPSRQMSQTLYPDLVDSRKDRVPSPLEPVNGREEVPVVVPRRALGGFAGGFGGVSSLKSSITSSPKAPFLSPVKSATESESTCEDYLCGVQQLGPKVSNTSGCSSRRTVESTSSSSGFLDSRPMDYLRHRARVPL